MAAPLLHRRAQLRARRLAEGTGATPAGGSISWRLTFSVLLLLRSDLRRPRTNKASSIMARSPRFLVRLGREEHPQPNLVPCPLNPSVVRSERARRLVFPAAVSSPGFDGGSVLTLRRVSG